MYSTTTRTPKNLDQQRNERQARAEAEYPLYSVRLVKLDARGKDGRDLSQVVATVRLKAPKKAGEAVTSYTVTEFGCNCPDSLKAREAGIRRTCKHEHMVTIYLRRQTLISEETPAAPALTAERRAQIRANMANDFPAD